MKKNTVLHLEFYTVRSLVVIKRRLRSSGRSHIKTRSATISSDMTWSATILSKDSFASQIFLIFTQIRFLIHRKKLSPPCMAGLDLDNCTFCPKLKKGVRPYGHTRHIFIPGKTTVYQMLNFLRTTGTILRQPHHHIVASLL